MDSPIRSMTAFARLSAEDNLGNVTWEIRAVNHRYLDSNIRLPEIFTPLESTLREILRKYLKRGHVECFLKYQPNADSGFNLTFDEKLVNQLIANVNAISDKIKKPVSIDPMTLLAWPNVLQAPKIDLSEINVFVLKNFEATVQDLLTTREREGAALKGAIESILSNIDGRLVKVHELLPQVLNTTRQKLLVKFAELKAELDPVRLEQEMILFAQKIDVTEELDRLGIHLKEFRRTLLQGGVVGKRLDFLLQELNREVNTLTAKSVEIKITQIALEIKVLLEQIREQVQNLE